MIGGYMRENVVEERQFGFDANGNGVYAPTDLVGMYMFRAKRAGELGVSIN